MFVRRGVGAVAAAVAAVLLLAGCAAGPAASSVSPPIAITHPHVQLSCPDVPVGHLDAVPDEVVAVFHCSADYHEVQGVMNKVQYVDELKEDPAALLQAYAAPNEPRFEGPCTEEYRDPLIIWIELPGGEFVAAHAPLDGCGKPQDSAAAAFETADFHRVFVAREVETP